MKFRDLLLLASGVAAASQVSALSLGNSQGNVQLGSPVDLEFQIQPDAGQTADHSCVTAAVWMGDNALNSSQVHLIAQGKTVRLRTTAPVYEPLLTVRLTAGCAGSVSRSYTFFADPPGSLAASVQPIDLSKLPTSAVPSQALLRPAPVSQASKPTRPSKRAVNPQAVLANAAPASSQAAAAVAVTSPPAEAAAAPLLDTVNNTSKTLFPTALESGEKPRLRVEPLDGLDATLNAETPFAGDDNAISQASTAIAPDTQQILYANTERLAGLEKQLLALQSQLTNNRSEISSLQSQLVQAQDSDLPYWVYLMLALLALALATVAWLLQRIQRERQLTQRAWADTVLEVEDSARAVNIDTYHTQPASEPAATMPPPLSAAAVSAPAASPLPADAAAASTEETQHSENEALLEAFEDAVNLDAAFNHITATAPPVELPPTLAEVLTAQALFDVQEQAEFYASIGENDQAIEILQAHLAKHESSSPLTYIELLQLLYRLSRTDAFEQVREKFHRHFHVQVPSFLGFARKGRDLWSSHPEVLGKIEALWPTDEVLALLRSLIVRQTATEYSDADVRFDLAAFDDLLMLYNVAQTTPASSRGQLAGRIRTAPNEVPLPEVVFDTEQPSAAPTHKANLRAFAAATPPLSLQEAHLDMLATAPADAPIAAPTLLSDSPFQGSTHFAPNEVLVEGLSLDWEMPSAQPSPAAVTPTSADTGLDFDAEVLELEAFMMDERDLPSSKQDSLKKQ